MKQPSNGKLLTGVGVLSIVGLILLLGCVTEVSAQFRRGPQLDPEKAQAAWTLAARGVANDLGLSKKVTSQLIDAYKAARESYQKAMEELRGTGDRGFEGFRELAGKERGKLETALKGFLNDKQAAEAIASLGTFNREWDRFLDVIAGFNLDDEKLFKALALVSTYVVDFDKARSSAMASQDWESIRTAREELKGKLDSGIAEVLSKEQLATWNEATAPRRRG